MRCSRCGGELLYERRAHRLRRAGYTLIIEDMPLWSCGRCGHNVVGEAQERVLQEMLAYLDGRVQQLRPPRA